MVDNKDNQWDDDTQYIDDADDELSYSYDDEENAKQQGYSTQDNEEYSEYDDEEEYADEEYEDGDEYDDSDEPVRKKGSPILLIILALILLGVAAGIAIPKLMANKGNAVAQNEATQNVATTENAQSTDDLANSFFDAAGGDSTDMMSVDFNENGETNVTTGEGEEQQVATVTEASKEETASSSDLFDEDGSLNIGETEQDEEENNAIMVVYNKVANMNPFKPPVVDKEDDSPFETIDDSQFEIIEPPTSSVPDENLTRLLQTQISGILYDEESPSAIVNLNGMDQFVKQGDVVSGYKIVNITRDKVEISYKNNSYVASVGQLFTRGSLEKQAAIVNLENKFAGRYKNNNVEE